MATRDAMLGVVCVAALAGAASAQPRPAEPTDDAPRPPSYAIYPTQRIPLRFDHRRHLSLPGVTCEGCHSRAATSTSTHDRLTPPESRCTPCHAIDRAQPERVVPAGQPVARCAGCHEGWDPATPLRVARVEVPPSNLRFSHAAHADRPCVSCHVGVARVGLATRLELPRMESCLGCHRAGGSASGRCATCHLTEPDGVLTTRFAEGWLNPPRSMAGLHHDADFWFTHRASAQRDATRCATCHRDDDCAACHDGRARDRRTHPNDYLTQHPADARLRADRCTSCHRTTSFCVGCHDRAGVGGDSPALSRALGRFHPPREVWSGRAVGARHHGVEARRAMTTCVSCHSEGDCVSCHATRPRGGGGFSPHPPGFRARCGSLLRASERPCAQCHDDLDALRVACP
jgi:hypothetical protein